MNLPPDHYLSWGMEGEQPEAGSGKSLAPIINWRRSSWCQRSSQCRWPENRWEGSQYVQGTSTEAQKRNDRKMTPLPCREHDWPCRTCGMLAACLICRSDAAVITWAGCLGVAGVGGLIWARVCACAEPTGDELHMLFPRHLTEIQVWPHQLDMFPALIAWSQKRSKRAKDRCAGKKFWLYYTF